MRTIVKDGMVDQAAFDQYVLDLELKHARALAALKLIASFQDKTLIAPSLGEDADRGHQIGANKAFNQAAEIALKALEP